MVQYVASGFVWGLMLFTRWGSHTDAQYQPPLLPTTRPASPDDADRAADPIAFDNVIADCKVLVNGIEKERRVSHDAGVDVLAE